MSQIDINSWRSYKIGDLFDIERGKVKGLQQKETGTVPIIAAARQNQGVAGYYNVESLFENKITISCNGAGCGSTFYHPYKFNINGDAIVLSEKMKISDSAKQFIACILDVTFIKKYSYEEKCSADKAKNEIIKLPTITKLTPDYQNLEILAGGGIDMSKIDTSSWKEFKLTDIAKLENGNKLDIGKMTQLSPSINFVSRTAKNNGVSSIVDKIEGIEPYPAGCLTLAFGGSVGSCFLQEKPFYTGQNVGVIMFSEEISLEAKRYLTTSLGNRCKLSYQAFGNEINRHFKTDLSVKLPATETYEPDWQYMEEYMKNIESEVTSKIDKFQIMLSNEKHKIDTQKWRGYRIGDLFEIRISKSINKIDLNFTSDGKYDFVGRTSTNNGIQGHMAHIKTPPNSKQTFSVAQIGENVCLYRDNEWYSSQNIFCLTPKYIELIQCNKFITSAITNQLKATFGLDAYSNYPTLKTLSALIVKLPTLDRKPDWGYMENYINNIKCKVCQNISSMEEVGSNG